MQKQQRRESARIRRYKVAAALYKQRYRVKEYKLTNSLKICEKIDVPQLCNYYEQFRLPIKEEDKQIYRQIDDLQHRVLRSYDNINDFITSTLDYDTLELPFISNVDIGVK